MRTFKFAALLGAAVMAVAAAPAADPDPFTYQPIEADGAEWVGADPAGDWGGGGETGLAGHAAGQDLTNAWIRASQDEVEFILQVTYLPTDPGGVPEGTRYTWDMTVDGVELDLDGKFTNISRGTCDPTSGQCDPVNGKMPRVPDERMFVLRGLCETNTDLPINMTWCQELASVQATFRPSTGTISIRIPAGALIPALNVARAEAGLAPLAEDAPLPACTEIAPAEGTFGGTISAAPATYVTFSSYPMDLMTLSDEPVYVPNADGSPC